jgi:GNAT superfamily N-acetyltransferase
VDDAAERIARGFVDAECKRRRKVVGAEVIEIDGLVLMLSNLPDPQLNGVFIEREPSDPAAALEAAEEEYRRRRMVFGIDLQVGRNPSVDIAVRAAGLERILERPGMAVALADLAYADAPDGVEIARVTDDVGARALVAVGVEAFGDDPEVGAAFYGVGAYGIEGGSTFVAWEEGEPVAISGAYVHDGATGVLGVGVVPRARRRGIGAAMTVVGARAFDDADMAWLHPSPMAERMYERLGFRTVCDWEVWIRSGTPHA